MKHTVITRNGLRNLDLNRRRAIRKFCQDCSNYSWEEVLNCEFYDCPLYPFRMGKLPSGTSSDQRAEAIATFCLHCSRGDPYQRELCPENDCPLHPFRLGK